jgi:hypothetical protein
MGQKQAAENKILQNIIYFYYSAICCSVVLGKFIYSVLHGVWIHHVYLFYLENVRCSM